MYTNDINKNTPTTTTSTREDNICHHSSSRRDDDDSNQKNSNNDTEPDDNSTKNHSHTHILNHSIQIIRVMVIVIIIDTCRNSIPMIRIVICTPNSSNSSSNTYSTKF